MSKQPQAGNKKSFLGLATEHFLAPLPLPTGRKPNNTMGMVWRINDTYMDVSDCTPGSAVATLHFMLVISILFITWMSHALGTSFSHQWPIVAMTLCFVIAPIIAIIILIYVKPREPMRFNRQRREVCVPAMKGGDYWYVPWETVKASVEGFNMVSQAGVNKNGSFMIGFPNPNFTGNIKLESNGYCDDENAERHLLFLNIVPEVGAGMWELIRTYMEEGADKINVDISNFEVRKEGIIESYITDVKETIAKRGAFFAFWWDGVFGLILLNTLLVDYIQRKHLNPPPDLIGDEVEAWSKPLPEEQWAKRSPELEQALRELEAKQSVA